uniref:Uncharacterized protein n=1 Tax=Strombidium inclinatum TaxID=197538 RepID=A0A7S3IRR7_9SPIT
MNFSEGISQIFVPTSRAFKGYAIIFLIYGTAMFYGTLLISVLTTQHLKVDTEDPDEKSPEDIEHDRQVLVKWMLSFGIVFYVISLVSFALMKKYKETPGISAQEMERKKLLKKYGDDAPNMDDMLD